MDNPDEPVKDEKITPLEVKIINQPKKESTPYTDTDNENYENINITPEEIEEFIDST